MNKVKIANKIIASRTINALCMRTTRSFALYLAVMFAISAAVFAILGIADHRDASLNALIVAGSIYGYDLYLARKRKELDA